MGSQGSPVKSYDYLLKFLLVGDSDVGKGEILDSLQDGSAESPYAYSSGESSTTLRGYSYTKNILHKAVGSSPAPLSGFIYTQKTCTGALFLHKVVGSTPAPMSGFIHKVHTARLQHHRPGLFIHK